MKKSIHLLFILNLVLLCGCEKNSLNPINSDLIVGTWRLTSVTFNGMDGNSINNWVSSSTILSLSSDNTYYRNYVVGEWEFNHTTLALNAEGPSDDFDWEYEVLDVTEEILRVRISLNEGEYCCDFEEFEDNELLVIEESYTRSQ